MRWQDGAPLLPSPDDGRGLLRRELLDPRYHSQDLLEALLDRLGRILERGLAAAGAAPLVPAVVASALLLALVLAGLWLASRARTSARSSRARSAAVLREDALDAADLRARAGELRAQGRLEESVLEGFRALARQQVELGRLPEDPGATAREVAEALDGGSARVLAVAARFEEVCYGGATVSAEQADEVLALDRELAARR